MENPVKKKTDINSIKSTEEVRKLMLELKVVVHLSFTWGDLDDRQKMQYWKEGKVTFERIQSVVIKHGVDKRYCLTQEEMAKLFLKKQQSHPQYSPKA